MRHPKPLDTLNAEWCSLATSRPCGPTGIAWASITPLLQVQQVGELVQMLTDGSRGPQQCDELLWPLLKLAVEGDELAARTVLQAMLGVFSRLGHRARLRGLDDPAETALEALWSAILTYPLHRRQRVAANLAGEALGMLPMADHHLEPRPAPVHEDSPAQEAQAPDTEEAAALLLWARRHRVLNAAELELLTEVYMHGTPSAAVATAQGLSDVATRKRLSRATSKLARAVRVRLENPTSQDVLAEISLTSTRS